MTNYPFNYEIRLSPLETVPLTKEEIEEIKMEVERYETLYGTSFLTVWYYDMGEDGGPYKFILSGHEKENVIRVSRTLKERK